jgi:hypothetical protein
MKSNFLFPCKFRYLGLAITLTALILTIFSEINDGIPFLKDIQVFALVDSGIPFSDRSDNVFFKLIRDDFDFELISTLWILGGIFLGFSRQKDEDEFITKIRLESLVWATYIHFGILLILNLTLYGIGYSAVLLGNMFTILLIFNILFYLRLFKFFKQSNQ